MVEGPCSIPLEHNMKENSKTTCTTAQEHTPSRMVLCVKVTFIITGKKIYSGKKKDQINIKDNYYMRVFILKDANMSFGSLHRRCNWPNKKSQTNPVQFLKHLTIRWDLKLHCLVWGRFKRRIWEQTKIPKFKLDSSNLMIIQSNLGTKI